MFHGTVSSCKKHNIIMARLMCTGVFLLVGTEKQFKQTQFMSMRVSSVDINGKLRALPFSLSLHTLLLPPVSYTHLTLPTSIVV